MQPKIQYIQGSKKYWLLLEEVQVTLSNGQDIKIPEGYVWDLSSVPRFLWGLFPPFGDFLMASLVHDWLYNQDFYRAEMGDYYARLFCDAEMLILSNKHNPNGKLDNYIRYYAVRLFGWPVFKRWNNGKAKRKLLK